MRYRLDVGRPLGSLFSGLKPVAYRAIWQSGFREMVGDGFRLAFDNLGEFLLENLSKRRMDLGASALEQTGISGIAQECMLESINCLRNSAATEDQLRLNQLLECFIDLASG